MSNPSRVPAPNGPNSPAVDEQPQERGSWLSWFMGWIVVPSIFLASIFGGGVLFGAHLHESWWTKAVLWIASVGG